MLFVPIITYKSKCDDTCILEVGDHPFIKHKSCVHYARIELRNESHLLSRYNYRLQEQLSSDVLNRVVEGIRTSELTPPWVTKNYWKILKPYG